MRLAIYLFVIAAILQGGSYANNIGEIRLECSRVTKSEMVSVNDIVTLGETLSGDSGTSSLFPCWLDLNLQEPVKNLNGNILANWPSLMRKSSSPEKALKRYLTTGQQFHLWYHSDIFSPSWETSIRNVRKIHSYASFYVESLNSSTSKLTATPEDNPTGFQPNLKLWKAFKMDLREFYKGSQSVEFEKSDPKFKMN
ncbi:unnamed protein product [Allacma fusca]|uniref:Uncharacterized protein n=1 Tax=Allacma fusca TaxID=39272 RepID=A0A8J2KW87_9HEXA|nr:unnamed protein product [Allacma fusca]